MIFANLESSLLIKGRSVKIETNDNLMMQSQNCTVDSKLPKFSQFLLSRQRCVCDLVMMEDNVLYWSILAAFLESIQSQ